MCLKATVMAALVRLRKAPRTAGIMMEAAERGIMMAIVTRMKIFVDF